MNGSGAPHIAVVGGGYTGLSAAYDLTRVGFRVSLFEAEDDLGGLAGTFEVSPGYRLEKFYHHWFKSDRDIFGLIDEIGLGDRVRPLDSNTGLYYINRQFRLSSPLDLLGFSPLPLLDRVRLGLMAIRARTISDWMPLEEISALEWIRKIGGKRGCDLVWEPLIRGKFGPEAEAISAVWIWNKLKLRGGSRGRRGQEQLVYMSGGFEVVTKALEAKIREAGGSVYRNIPVNKLNTEGGVITGIETDLGYTPVDGALVTTPVPTFLKLCPDLPKDYSELYGQIRYLGNLCLILRLKRSLSTTYWLNVLDPEFPFVGVIEHTNLDDPNNYGGERIAYISKYLPTSDPRFSLNTDEYLDYSFPFLKKLFPELNRDWLIGSALWKAEYSQPVITKNYSKFIPKLATPIENLWLATMAQIYPEDRGTNYAIRSGRQAASEIMRQFRQG